MTLSRQKGLSTHPMATFKCDHPSLYPHVPVFPQMGQFWTLFITLSSAAECLSRLHHPCCHVLCAVVRCEASCCSGPIPTGFSELKFLQTLNIENSGMSNGNTTNSLGENLPSFLYFDR